MPVNVTLSDKTAALLAADAARAGLPDVAQYLSRLIVDERVRREGSRRCLLLSRAEGMTALYQTEDWVWDEEVRMNFTAVGEWIVRTGRPLRIVINGQPLLVLQSETSFMLTRRWFELARHFLTHP